MPNMSLKKVAMPEQEPNVRNKNFNEVALGYTFDMAIEEANRCMNCKQKPCTSGCPVQVNIPKFIQHIKYQELEEAYQTITESNLLPAICGRVCPQETQCESKCLRGLKGEPVAIGRLERFVADYHMANEQEKKVLPPTNGHKVAIIGSGPSGLSCASDLAKLGYKVTIFEAFHVPGGVLVYGIPEFRLPKKIVQKEIDNLKNLGVDIKTNMVIGKTLTIDDLQEMGYEAFFVGTGAGTPNFMNIPGENLIGVYSANEYLTRINLMKAYLPEYDTPIRNSKVVAVIGGGNVAMDAARSAKRLGTDKVYIIYRRSLEEMPARKEEIHHAMEEGIIFETQTNPIRIIGDDNNEVKAIECIKMALGQTDDSGRRQPIPIEGSNYFINADTVIMAIGTSPNYLIRQTTPGIETNKWGGLVVDENMKTTRDSIYAGGDAVTGAATVILAMGAGKIAAKSIHEYLQNRI
ncbi:MAG TPA: NADPH-dependent glutamate synthase [Haloplasmataceae bacterium]